MIDLAAEWDAALQAMTPEIELELIRDWGIPSLHFLRKRVLSSSAEILNSAPRRSQARGADRHSPASSHDDLTLEGPLKCGAVPSESEAGEYASASGGVHDRQRLDRVPASEDHSPQSSRPPHPYEWPMIGRARVVLDGRHLYQPHEAGEWCFITPVCRQDPDTFASDLPGAWVRWGQIVDLCAWHPASPDKWALRTGEADWLGLILYPSADPVPIYRTPLSWLRASTGWADWFGPGLALLSPSTSQPRPFQHLSAADLIAALRGGIVAENYAHREELRRACHIIDLSFETHFRQLHGRDFFSWAIS
jgi:hypothetical protein